MFNNFFSKQNFLTKQEIINIQNAIANAEKQTSGEIRIFIEKKTKNQTPLHNAKEIFVKYKMEQTKERNGILIYVAYIDKKVAIFGDEGINKMVSNDYWQNNINTLISNIKDNKIEKGFINLIINIGEKLKQYFPYNEKTDTNELSNEIIFK